MGNEKKHAVGGRKQFVRVNVPAAERIASGVILILLAAIALAIYFKGRTFDPNRFVVRTEALKSTAAAVEGKAGTAPSASQGNAVANRVGGGAAERDSMAEDPSSEGEEAYPNSAATAVVKSEPLEIGLPGMKPMGETEFYTSDNLYEKIDGRAPTYQDYNVQSLRCRSFSPVASPDSFVDVYEYRFDTPINAFGMFAQERDPGGKPLDFAADGYSGEMGYFFRQGAVYVQIIASDQKPETLALASQIAKNRAKELPPDDKGLAGRRNLPATGLIAESVSFVPENAQGLAVLKDVFQARYKFDDVELSFFIMVTTPTDAAKGWQALKDFCAKFGSTENLADVKGGRIFSAQVFGKWKVVYQREGELGGVYDADDVEKARQFVEQHLRGRTP